MQKGRTFHLIAMLQGHLPPRSILTFASLAESLKQSVSRCTWVACSRCTERASMACARNLFTRFVGWWYTDE